MFLGKSRLFVVGTPLKKRGVDTVLGNGYDRLFAVPLDSDPFIVGLSKISTNIEYAIPIEVDAAAASESLLKLCDPSTAVEFIHVRKTLQWL
jgi:hypothetical protein